MLENTQIFDSATEPMPSLNHSYVCAQLLRQLLRDEAIQPLPELTLDIDNGLTPDISVFVKENVHPDFFEDVLKMKEMPILAIEVVSSSQNIQSVLEKSKVLVDSGVKTVWAVEPYSRSVFVMKKEDKQLFHEEPVESEGIRVDFAQVFRR